MPASEMTSDLSQPSAGGVLGLLRSLGSIAALVGAVGSAELTVRAGRTTPRFLLVLIILWVLSPFALYGLGYVFSRRWSASARATLYVVMLLIVPASLAIYANSGFRPAGAKAGAVFVAVPPASWIIMALSVGLAMFASRRRAQERKL
jgi:hypothetical protein